MRVRKWQICLLLFLTAGLIAPADEGVHKLARDETIYGIARRYGLTADALLSYNGISDQEARSLAVGFELRIPGTYVVKQGEYPFSIARQLGVNWLELLEANGLTRDAVVRPGDLLVIPGGRQAATARVGEGEGNNALDEGSEGTAASGNAITSVTVPEGTDWPHPGRRRDYEGRFSAVVIDGIAGDEISSVTAGQVSYVGPFTSFGRIVIVQSTNGYQYVYMGVDTLLVDTGDRVERGSPIGLVGYSPALEDSDVLFTVWNGTRFVHPSVAPRG